jgi:HEAT repeat protein
MSPLTLPRSTGFVLLLMSMALGQQQPQAQGGTSVTPEKQTSPAIRQVPPQEQAWKLLETGVTADKTAERSVAVRVLGLLQENRRALELAEAALDDNQAEVRAAAAAALGEIGSPASIPSLRKRVDDDDPAVALAAAHALLLLKDNSGYQVFYEVLTGKRKTGKGLIAAEASKISDPKKLAQLGFEEGIGFLPFASMGWGAIKALAKDDTSPVRAAAAKVLARDPDPDTIRILTDAAGDKSWLVRAASLEALAKRGDSSVLTAVELYLDDNQAEVKYTAAAAVLHLMDLSDAAARKH